MASGSGTQVLSIGEEKHGAETIEVKSDLPCESGLNGRSEAELVEEQMNLPIEYVKNYEKEVDYRNKLVLAPMVRTGSCR